MKLFTISLMILFLMVAQSGFAGDNDISSLVSSIKLGITIDKVKEKLPALEKASYGLQEGVEAFDLKKPQGDITMLRCAFVKSKLALFTFETKDNMFDKTRSVIEANYGSFIEKDNNVLRLQGPGSLSIRVVRTGTDGTAAHVIISDPSLLPCEKAE